MKKNPYVINVNSVEKLLSVIDKGLCEGMGQPKPGQMCVEAAVCYAFDQEHSDRPTCVPKWLSDLKININDDLNVSKKIRAKILRRLAVAQLGSKHINQSQFKKIVIPKINTILRFIAATEKYTETGYINGLYSIPSRFNEILENIERKKAVKIIIAICDVLVDALNELESEGSEYLGLCG